MLVIYWPWNMEPKRREKKKWPLYNKFAASSDCDLIRFLHDRSEVSSLRMFNLLILDKFLSLYLFQIAPRIMVLFIE